MAVARSSSGMLTIGRIAYCREGVFFFIENVLSAERGMGVQSAGEVCYLRSSCFHLLEKFHNTWLHPNL